MEFVSKITEQWKLLMCTSTFQFFPCDILKLVLNSSLDLVDWSVIPQLLFIRLLALVSFELLISYTASENWFALY